MARAKKRAAANGLARRSKRLVGRGDKINRHGFAVGLNSAAECGPASAVVGIAGLFNDGGERIAGLKVGKSMDRTSRQTKFAAP
jgi:hypothetical protein